MNSLLYSLAIAAILTFIIDWARPQEAFKHFIWKLLNGNIPYKHFSFKPFDCSLCLSFWVTLFVTLYLGEGLLSFLYASIAGYSTSFISPLLRALSQVWNDLLYKLTKITQ